MNGMDLGQLETKLRDLWIDNFHVFISLVKFERGKAREHVVPLKSHSQEASVGFMDHSKGSFAIMVRGGPIQAKVIAPSLDLEGKVVNGFRVWFGLKFLGIPCCAWSDIAVSVVVGHWGDVCFLEDDIQASLSVKRVCIKTIKPNLIHDKLMVVVQGISYELPPDHFFPPKVVDAGNGLAVGVACPSAATIEASRVPFPTTIVVVSQPEWVHDRVFEGVDYVSLSQRLWFRRAYILRHEDDVVLSSLSLKNTSSSSHDGVWIAYNLECFMVNVYAPLDMVGKQQWWDRLSLFFRKHRGNFIIFGDFNIVRSANERFGSVFSNTYVENFNEFTDDIGAVDVPIG
uniref:RNA-directed DNA polymerase, eukaryota n=1 Tax=Lactuca sativa TaxID=4236 RepID=A0A9R1UTE3_LACSA|nr:hypothetical protein LSAT_V11C800425020 [Lactuca sativa]